MNGTGDPNFVQKLQEHVSRMAYRQGSIMTGTQNNSPTIYGTGMLKSMLKSSCFNQPYVIELLAASVQIVENSR